MKYQENENNVWIVSEVMEWERLVVYILAA